MAEARDWRVASWEENRLRQHRAFRALPFRDKVLAIEELARVAAFFAERRRVRGLPVHSWEEDHGVRGPGRASDPNG